MLAASGLLPPDSAKWAYEVKWDGFRALVQASPAGITISSRNGYDMTSRYPELEGLRHAVSTPVLLDGEIVDLDADSRPDFAALWFRSRGSADPGTRLCFMAFDVLKLAGKVLIDRPYRERRGALDELSLEGPNWSTPEAHIRDGAALFAATKRMGLEGVVAKRLDSRYRPGTRSKAWTKTKHFQQRTFALLGWLPPGEWRGDRGCVVLGLRTPVGIGVSSVVESGYDRELVDRLPELSRAQLRELQKPGRVWTGSAPLVGQVKFLEWSPAGGLRHAVLVGPFTPPALGAALVPGAPSVRAGRQANPSGPSVHTTRSRG
jgi:bifunctional non-homologous end joining protein LigD